MLKRIIFDLDDTLIDWKDEYWKAVEKALSALNIAFSPYTLELIKESVENYEKTTLYYNKQDMLNAISTSLKIELPYEFMEIWQNYFGFCIPSQIESEKIKALTLLSSKYELVILTDWFKDSQINRLQNSDLLKYFQEVYASEDFPRKPNSESYLRAMGNYTKEEVIIIGDSLFYDIETPMQMGIPAIYYNPKHKDCASNILSISNFQEIPSLLKQIF